MTEPVAYRGWTDGKEDIITVTYDERDTATITREVLESLLYGMAYFDD